MGQELQVELPPGFPAEPVPRATTAGRLPDPGVPRSTRPGRGDTRLSRAQAASPHAAGAVDRRLLETVMQRVQPDAFWDMIDGVLVVNLDSRPDRWRELQAAVAGVVPAHKLHRLPATLGAALPGFGAPPWFRGRKRDKTWAGRAGCALSHRAAIAYAREQGWRTVLILEDDIEFAPALNAVLSALPAALQAADWQVCYLGFTDPVSPYRTLARLPEGHE